MSMTVISDKFQMAEADAHMAPIMITTSEHVNFYDKNATLLNCDDEQAWPEAEEAKVWVRGEVKDSSAGCIQMNSMLCEGRVLAMAEEKGLVFQKKEDGNIIFYSVISGALPLSKVSSVEDLRQMLKTTFAGWHHAYHEVFAMAKSFSYFLANKLKPETIQLAH